MQFNEHHYDLPSGQVVQNLFSAQEDVVVQLRTHEIKFEMPDIDSDGVIEETTEVLASISTNNSGLRVSLNQYNNSTIEFYDNANERASITIYGNRIDLNNNRIASVANPTSALDAVNRQYCQLFQLPIGTILPFYGTTIPAYYLLCNGSTFNQATYPDLYVLLGNSNVLPDLRGCFLRMKDPTGIRDPDADRPIGNIQSDSLREHLHGYSYKNNSGTGDFVAADESGNYMRDGYMQSANTGLTGGSETRPINACVNYIIAAKKVITYGEI